MKLTIVIFSLMAAAFLAGMEFADALNSLN